MRLPAAVFAVALLIASATSVLAQSGEQKQETKPQGAADAAKDEKKKADEFAEAARVLTSSAGHPECVWLGRRVVNLLWRDDLDTAFRHLDLYDRFGCPGGHIQTAFRCVVRLGNIDPKAPDSLNARVHGCWINPAGQQATAPASVASPPQATGSSAPQPGGNPQ